MAWCSVKKSTGTTLPFFTFYPPRWRQKITSFLIKTQLKHETRWT
jgi:hypothetical protein